MKTNVIKPTINNETAVKMATTYQSGIDWTTACSSDDKQNGIFNKRAELMPKPSIKDKIKAAEAVAELVESCLDLISFVVDEYVAQCDDDLNYDDLLSAGRTGFIQGLICFEPESDLLSDFVVPYINKAISAFLADSDVLDAEMPT